MPEAVEVIDYRFGLDPKDAIKAAQKFQSEMSRRLKLVEKSEDRVNQSISRYITKVGSAKRVFGPVLEKQLKLYEATSRAIADTRHAISGYRTEITSLDGVLERLRERESTASDEELRAIKERISEVQRLKSEREKVLKTSTGEMESQQEALKKIGRVASEARQQIEIEPTLKADALREAGEELTRPLAAFMRKDFPGAMEAGVGFAGKAFKSFAALGKADTSTMDAGPLKAIAGLSKTMSPLVRTLGKLAPAIGLVAGAMMSIVKLFLDAESAAKDFHKQILETSSTSGYLGANLGNVADASKQLEADLRDLRDGAMSWSNVQWGISKEVSGAFISALTAEGVTMRQLGEETERATGYARSHAQVTQMSVAYSRAFGISLNEITQLQGEMMTEMGMGLDSIQAGFQEVVRGAEQANMASNKFFGIVRSFSSDLSLFTLRMADLTKVMTVLGKTMSPRNAQKFLQTLTQQFKGAGLMDRVRTTMLGGKGATKNILQEDVSRRLGGLAADLKGIGVTEEGLRKAVATGSEDAAAQYMAQFVGEISGAQREAIQDATIMQGKLNSGNMIEVASALKDASPIAAMQILDQVAQRRFGKPVSELTGLQKVAFESMTGFNDEQIDQQRKMVAGLAQTRYDLAHKIGQENKNLTDVELEMLNKLDLAGKSDEEQIRALKEQVSDADVWHAMSSDQQKLLEDSAEQINFQKEAARLQVSTIDQLGVIADILMNYVYNILTDIWGTLVTIASPFLGGNKDFKRFETQIAKLQDVGATRTLNQSGGDIWKARTGIIETSGKRMLAQVEQAKAEKDALIAKGATTKDEGELAAIKARLDLLGNVVAAGANTGGVKGLYDVDPTTMATRLGGLATALREANLGVGAPANVVGAMPGVSPVTASAAPVEVKDGAKAEDQQKTTDQVKKVEKTLKKNVSLAKPSSGYTSAVEDSTLGAIRQGLFEYYLYSGLNREDVAAGLATGMSREALVGGIESQTASLGSTEAAFQAIRQGNARGGIVAGLAGKMAAVDRFPPAPPGEGWAAVRPGEAIMPAGRGGGGRTQVELRLKGDLGRFIDARVVNGTAEFQRNRRLR